MTQAEGTAHAKALQRAACVAGIYDEKVAGRREQALGLVSWVFAYVKEHL